MEKSVSKFGVEFGYAGSTQEEGWKIKGDYWAQKRKEYGISRREMARRLLMTDSRLARFEKGEAVKFSNSIVMSYKMQFEIIELKEENRLLKMHGATASVEANKKNKIIFI